MLAFGYATIYKNFMGNITSRKIKLMYIQKHKYFTLYFERIAKFADIQYKEYDFVLRLTNDFGWLHFISRGSRGVEPFPFIQLMSVYKWQVWVFLFISITFPSLIIVKLYSDGSKSVSLINRFSNKHIRFITRYFSRNYHVAKLNSRSACVLFNISCYKINVTNVRNSIST